MKNRNIIIALIVVTAQIFILLLGYFFIPVNSHISPKITKSTPISLFPHAVGNEKPLSCLTQSGELKDEDLSLIDEIIFFNLISRCRYENGLNNTKTGKCNVIFQIKLPSAKTDGEYTEIFIFPPKEGNLHEVSVQKHNYTKYEVSTYSLKANPKYIELLREIYSKKGFRLKMKKK